MAASVLSSIFNGNRGVLSNIFSTASNVFATGATRIGASNALALGATFFTTVAGISSMSSLQSSTVVVQNFSVTCASRSGFTAKTAVVSQQTGGTTALNAACASRIGVSNQCSAVMQVQAAIVTCNSSFGISNSTSVREHGTQSWTKIVSAGGIWTTIDKP